MPAMVASHFISEFQLVSCKFHEGVLTLRGRVSTVCLQQIAQTLMVRPPATSGTQELSHEQTSRIRK
jgi:hypothetical protein